MGEAVRYICEGGAKHIERNLRALLSSAERIQMELTKALQCLPEIGGKE
jgi:hypothetical protein